MPRGEPTHPQSAADAQSRPGPWQACEDGYELCAAGLHARLNLGGPSPGLTALELAGWPKAEPAQSSEHILLGIDGISFQQAGRAVFRPLGDADALIEHHARQEEVVATYRAVPNRPARLTLYWQARAPLVATDPLPGPQLDLQVLAQTDGRLRALQCLTHTGLGADEVLLWLDDARHRGFVPLAELTTPGERQWIFGARRPAPHAAVPDIASAKQLADRPRIVLWRLPGGHASYAEMCHPQDQVWLWMKRGQAAARLVDAHLSLFGQDLEKGVILRGRVRGHWLPRNRDEAMARQLFERFLAEPPPLTT